ncbi:T6SS effector amidase Tae4 family protein [Massilia horti]|uniref:Uncharacterized protein n=1 Tax=Massilia horti TaxID=2562153 RepID=A0A4Y9SYI5_9BURK|nr:T6SS effector amidase Tae4 family protein [Massilia horti]TFW31504.1 hypothetical protein E4O92_13670 [Massilia horti]
MKPLFAVLKANHLGRDVMSSQVHEAIGHLELAIDVEWQNTCAIRMSLALIAAGMYIRTARPRLWIKTGKFKGRQLEPSQRVLSDFLVHEIGKPEKYRSGADVHNTIAWRRGIISFFQIHGPTSHQGHINLVSVEDWPQLQCNSSCYWDSVEVWFWELH